MNGTNTFSGTTGVAAKEHTMIPAEDPGGVIEHEPPEEVEDLQGRESAWFPGDSREAELRETATAIDELTGAAGVPGRPRPGNGQGTAYVSSWTRWTLDWPS